MPQNIEHITTIASNPDLDIAIRAIDQLISSAQGRKIPKAACVCVRLSKGLLGASAGRPCACECACSCAGAGAGTSACVGACVGA